MLYGRAVISVIVTIAVPTRLGDLQRAHGPILAVAHVLAGASGGHGSAFGVVGIGACQPIGYPLPDVLDALGGVATRRAGVLRDTLDSFCGAVSRLAGAVST